MGAVYDDAGETGDGGRIDLWKLVLLVCSVLCRFCTASLMPSRTAGGGFKAAVDSFRFLRFLVSVGVLRVNDP